MGDCASTGGLFNNYAVVQGVDEVVSVDVYIAGCPPRPEALIHGILTLYDQILSASDSRTNLTQEAADQAMNGVHHPPIPNRAVCPGTRQAVLYHSQRLAGIRAVKWEGF